MKELGEDLPGDRIGHCFLLVTWEMCTHMGAGCGAGLRLKDPVCSRKVFCLRPSPVPRGLTLHLFSLLFFCGWNSSLSTNLQSCLGGSPWA